MMELALVEHASFAQKGTFVPSIRDIEDILLKISGAKAELIDGDDNGLHILAKLSTATKRSLDSMNSNLKEVHKASQSYARNLDRRLKFRSGFDAEAADRSCERLLDRAIDMHLLREGCFHVAAAFMRDTHGARWHPSLSSSPDSTLGSLRNSFVDMYHILFQMRTMKDLQPAMRWAKSKSHALQTRGSNLEFELAQLQFIWLFSGYQARNGLLRERQRGALMYAREAFVFLGSRHSREVQQLLGALAFGADIETSPYEHLLKDGDACEEVALSFTREYCSLLGLSADSPLFIATTAGAIALPMLEKLRNIMKEKRTEWTTEHELPVEIPLPLTYRFHSIFVCPVSKEQTTDTNPPMLLPCGHIIAKESLSRLSKLQKFKCPYCPEESLHSEARKVTLK